MAAKRSASASTKPAAKSAAVSAPPAGAGPAPAIPTAETRVPAPPATSHPSSGNGDGKGDGKAVTAAPAGAATSAPPPASAAAATAPEPLLDPIPTGRPAAEYNADSFSVLEGIAHVRKNPGMYLGSADEKGLHHLVWELVDNSIDEAMAGFCRNIDVRLHADGSVTVSDDGRGIPVDINKAVGKPALEIALTKVGGGAKHDNSAYQTSGGLHGMGLTCVNALSLRLQADIRRGGSHFRQVYEKGEKRTEIERVGDAAGTGTSITFLPETTLFNKGTEAGDPPRLRRDTIEARLKQQAYLNRGIRIRFADENDNTAHEFHYPEGIRDFVRELAVGRETVHRDVLHFERFDQATGMYAEVALQWSEDYKETIFCFANSIYNPQGGTHLSGLRSALTRTVKGYMDRNNLVKEKDSITGDDVHEGVIAVVSCRLPGRTFSGQEKAALISPEARGFVDSMVSEKLAARMEEKPDEAKRICGRVQRAAQGRVAAQKARETIRKSGLGGFGLPGKLFDCTSRDRLGTEVFLVEGDSAGGSAKTARDSKTQAVLPLRGKILNVEKARIDHMLGHNEIQALIHALGTGINIGGGDGSTGDMAFDLAKLRYGKVIIMTDADVDGSHIRTLLLTFFFRHMPQLVENGRIYIAQPPLFGIARGKNKQYVLNEKRLRDMLRDGALTDWSLVVRGRDGKPDATLDGEPLRELLRLLDQVETAATIVARRGHLWPRLLARFWSPEAWSAGRRLLPTHLVRVDGKDHWFHTDEEVAAFRKSREPAAPPPSAAPAAPPSGGADAATPAPAAPAAPALPFDHTVLTECRQLNELFAKVASVGGLGLSPADYLAARRERISGEQEPTRFVLVRKAAVAKAAKGDAKPDAGKSPAKAGTGPADEAGEAAETAADKGVEVVNLAELAGAVGRVGGKGLRVSRYKGLGEMNGEELRETTMDPAARTLYRVTLENAAEAERLFSTLMGKETDSRREYIEEHALEVRNLDV